jgi:hypothetical protein
MKYGKQEIKDLSDSQLISAFKYLDSLDQTRLEAAKNEKFKKMEFPPANPEFVKMRNEMHNEITTRKLVI